MQHDVVVDKVSFCSVDQLMITMLAYAGATAMH